MKLALSPFTKIAEKKKTIESRLFDEKRQTINVGDTLEFLLNDDLSKKITTKVKALYRYGSFKDLFGDFSPSFFGGESSVDLLEEIHRFYPPEEEEKYGVVGIKIEVV